MSVGCWGSTCCQLQWVVGGAWRKQRKSIATYTEVSCWVCCCHWGMTRIGVWSAKEGGEEQGGGVAQVELTGA